MTKLKVRDLRARERTDVPDILHFPLVVSCIAMPSRSGTARASQTYRVRAGETDEVQGGNGYVR